MPDLDDLLKSLGPQVLGILVRRGHEFAAAEDAVQEALIEAYRCWPDALPDNPLGWLVTVAFRKQLDAVRADSARQRRELRIAEEPPPGPAAQADDALLLLFLSCHPSLPTASAVALTLRAVGGLTTRQIAEAHLVPEPTMAQRISRAKRALRSRRLTEPGSLTAVLKVLYLIFNEGHQGDVDLAADAIHLTRQLAAASPEPEVAGLLALMLLHQARRASRWCPAGQLVPLADQDRSRWDTRLIAEGVNILQAALAKDALGEYQAQACIAALHADAATVAETDWHQILHFYDDLLSLTCSPVVALNRAVVVGEIDGPLAGLAALASVPETVPRHTAVRAFLRDRAGDTVEAHALYTAAAREATNAAERDHLLRQAARLHG